MAVLADPEAPAREPRPEVRRPPGRRRPVPRPRRDRTPPLPTDRGRAWLLTALLGAATLGGHLWHLGYPGSLLFDEAYYPREARELLRWGTEYNRGYTFIVHPPLGKWLIAAGEAVFGYDPVGWRFASAVAGAVAVVVLTRLTRRLTGSTFLGLVAGLLLALDGFTFVISRLGLLDVFLEAFVVSAVACLVVDRDRVRQRIGAHPPTTTGFRLGPRGWRIAAGFLLGCSCAVKWSGVWFLLFSALLSLFWDRSAWKAAGVPRPTRTALRRGLPGAAWGLGVVPLATYLASFTGWFLSETGQGRHWADAHPSAHFGWVPGPLRSLWHMHGEWLAFHDGLDSPHPWQSGPWSWIVDGRPILLWNPQGLRDAGGGQVVRYVLMVGTPTLWLLFAPAALWALWRLVARRDPAAGIVTVAVVAGWLTWFVHPERTMFIFYLAPTVPFLVLAITLALQDVLGPPAPHPVLDAALPQDGSRAALRRQLGLGAVCLYVAVVAATFAFFFPVLTGQPLSLHDWLLRMWFPSWF